MRTRTPSRLWKLAGRPPRSLTGGGIKERALRRRLEAGWRQTAGHFLVRWSGLAYASAAICLASSFPVPAEVEPHLTLAPMKGDARGAARCCRAWGISAVARPGVGESQPRSGRAGGKVGPEGRKGGWALVSDRRPGLSPLVCCLSGVLAPRPHQ